MIRRDDEEMNRAGYIYSPEESDGKTDWPTVIVTIGLTVIIAAIVIALLAVSALPAEAHDALAWSDPARDGWYRSLKVPGGNVSCCNFHDAAAVDPAKVTQVGTQWFIDLGDGPVAVPPERVVTNPPSIDGQPYVFLMPTGGIRCFVPPVPTY